ncbi:MAG: flagellar FlbD family protein [Butyrivibrio sp.]|nr:flagellar FlbD family protein [Butyrivibrio sp.]
MIELTRFNGTTFDLNPDLIELIDSTPDTVVTLTTGRKLIVKESRQEIKNLVLSYRRAVYANMLSDIIET